MFIIFSFFNLIMVYFSKNVDTHSTFPWLGTQHTISIIFWSFLSEHVPLIYDFHMFYHCRIHTWLTFNIHITNNVKMAIEKYVSCQCPKNWWSTNGTLVQRHNCANALLDGKANSLCGILQGTNRQEQTLLLTMVPCICFLRINAFLVLVSV